MTIRPGSSAHLAAQRADLLRFAARSRHQQGFGWLDDGGHLETSRPVELWITCRMTHTFALGVLADEAPAPGGPNRVALRELAAHGVASLTDSLADPDHGGWFAAVDERGVVDDRKQAYGHAFVLLAATSALAARVPGAAELLDRAIDVHQQHFWDEARGLAVEEWDASWSRLDDYRGVNANMHTVEAYLAVGDVLGERLWHERAGRISEQVVSWASANDWRIPEHFDAEWQPMLEHNADEPSHPFRPYGATVGHGLEWARLLVAVAHSLGDDAPAGPIAGSVALFDRAVSDGWGVDGADGFIYTTDWSGKPIVRTRMHWVLAEAVNTATVLRRETGEQRFADHAESWWAYAERYLLDAERGSWHHELDPVNVPSATVWPGKPDVYHAYQAALLPEVPTVPSFAAALAAQDGVPSRVGRP